MRSSTWVAVDVGMRWDPVILRLGRTLKCTTPEAWVVRVMAWLKLYSPADGQVSDHENDISAAINWTFRIGLVHAFAGAGLLDAKGCLAGWADLNGWLHTRAEKDRRRHREKGAAPRRKRAPKKLRLPSVTPAFSDTQPVRKASGNA